MKFVTIWSYDNYIPAHLDMGRLKEDGIQSWLKDENTVTIDPLLTNAVGGIKLMVAEAEAERALKILQDIRKDHKTATASCPFCSSQNLEIVHPTRKTGNWFSAITTFLRGNQSAEGDETYRCADCKREFAEPVISESSKAASSNLSS